MKERRYRLMEQKLWFLRDLQKQLPRRRSPNDFLGAPRLHELEDECLQHGLVNRVLLKEKAYGVQGPSGYGFYRLFKSVLIEPHLLRHSFDNEYCSMTYDYS